MEKMGIVRKSSSPWASLLFVVSKPNVSWRPCGAYRKIYEVVPPDRYTIPYINEYSSRLRVKTIFSKIHLFWTIIRFHLPQKTLLDNSGYFVWSIGVFTYAVRLKRCCPNIPKTYGLYPLRH